MEAAREPANRGPAWAAGVCAGVHAAGVRDVVYVPDNPLSHVLRGFQTTFEEIRLLLATREEEAFGIAAGLYLGGGRLPAVMLQSSGLGNSLNAITSLLIPFQIPVLVIVSMRGDLGEWNSAQVPMGRASRRSSTRSASRTRRSTRPARWPPSCMRRPRPRSARACRTSSCCRAP